MNEKQYQEIVAMLAVIYKKIDIMEQKAKGSTRFISDERYLEELREKANELIS